MKSLKLLPIALLLLYSSSMLAQMSGAPREFESTSQVYDELRKFLNTKQKDAYEIDWDNVKGSPYLNEKYKLAKFFIGNKSYGNVMMRYNTYSDEIELFTEDGKEMEALMKVENSRLTFEDKTLKLFTYKDEDGYEQQGYFLVLNNEKEPKLLLKKKCVFSPNEKALTANQADRAAKFTQYDYFYIVKEGKLIQVDPKKKAVVKLFPEKGSEIKKYIKSERLKLKRQKDFAKLVDYIATL
ncbi:hypothetical protein U8527_20490 [Kordia algicida OT-1]|uniref:Uncharacterized protein n=1 Tax=Kordia algicida OT-1 TaxID=391587 RepID=A9DKQ8_9FLAO|nr:hypothetical protein [Kordia algicida]EDP98379.1 hypothetical protein KAOT1_14217 [Kordia algicida OT-1]